MQLALARVGVDVGLFDALASSGGTTSTELACKTKVDIVLIGERSTRCISLISRWANCATERLLRYYQSVGMILQRGPDDFAPNNVTEALAWDGGRAGICVQCVSSS